MIACLDTIFSLYPMFLPFVKIECMNFGKDQRYLYYITLLINGYILLKVTRKNYNKVIISDTCMIDLVSILFSANVKNYCQCSVRANIAFYTSTDVA